MFTGIKKPRLGGVYGLILPVLFYQLTLKPTTHRHRGKLPRQRLET